jgi:hypothetical protein
MIPLVAVQNPCVIVNVRIGEIIPLSAWILVLSGGSIALKRVIHQDLAIILRTIGKLIPVSPFGDVRKIEGLHPCGVLLGPN